ncbi:serine hydrolase [Corallococcus sicarius]|uniref:beta-lactamase n=1 Tax=Corallococcus sicarius TaxID=2316726 RepID=A0A3A8N161_9BACT|nr:serine hydrolase [Corallococcus sicarius]RKH37289.1 serine hydrolase [Corallococcus sicarius]
MRKVLAWAWLLSLSACATKPDAAPPRESLQGVVDALASEAAQLSPGTDLALAVTDLRTGESASFKGLEPHISASSAKVFWVAAALGKRELEEVAPLAEKVFRTSDNEASGEIIDLVGGPDSINRFLHEFGLEHSALTKWNYGKPRQATNSPRAMQNDNYFCANDAVSFLRSVDQRMLLGRERGAQLMKWMELTPREGCGGWLGTRLPPSARASLQHKGGWLPPGCCSDDARYNVLNEMGYVTLPDGGRYAVAILTSRGPDWPRQAFVVERASCVLYRYLSKDPTLDCGDALAKAGGPAPVVLAPGAPAPNYDCE